MSIKEIEKLLNISRANIRFYEKEGLLNPKRSDNEYRTYSEDDIKKLKQIIIFRKCNISIEDIKKIFNGEKSLEQISNEQLTEIENKINELDNAKKICKMISKEKNNISNFDEEKYLQIISSEERKGNMFNNFAEDFFCSEEIILNELCDKLENGNKYKKWLRILGYSIGGIVIFSVHVLLDRLFLKEIDYESALFSAIFITILNIFMSKKYMNKKDNK